ncbi:MAG TPA: hypothetical protein VJY42_03035 [Candidatus Methanomethylophilaceae archaeon]|nr:hypothetical protein [Candidatus Methanomethylophilaceae archaeon]
MNFKDVLETKAMVQDALNNGYNKFIEDAEHLALNVSNDLILKCKGTEYELPTIYSWTGRTSIKSSEVSDIFSKKQFIGIDGALQIGIESSMAFDIISSLSDIEIVPDSWIDEIGTSLIDGTIPGIALFIGEPNERSLSEIKECTSKGLIVVLSGDYFDLKVDCDVLRLNGIQAMGFNGIITRTAIRYGNIEPGCKLSLAKYLKKRPKVITIHTGRLTVLDVAVIFSAAAVGAYTVSDSIFPAIPRFSDTVTKNMSSTAMCERGITFKQDAGIRSGSVFENEHIRKADTFIEFGGSKDTISYEIVRAYEGIEDGRIFVEGKDIPYLERGDYPLSIEVKVSGLVELVMEQAIERRIHFAISGIEGVWHSGQRDTSWIRVSNKAVENGITFKDIGDIIISNVKKNFGKVIDAVEILFSTVPSSVSSGLTKARSHYKVRDSKLVNITDNDVDTFFTCTICQTYAPGHICVITPERPSVCGSVTWLDAKVGSEINPGGHQRPFFKGELINADKGEWSGTNEIMNATSLGSIQRVHIHSVTDWPMTTCSCMEVAVAVSEDRRSILLIDRSDAGNNPSGYSFSEISAIVGRGSQRPGYMGIGKHYILSNSFLKGDGGLSRVSWISTRLKSVLGESLKRACHDVGGPDLYDKIADEIVVEDSKSLNLWILEKKHPSLDMEPLK